MMHLLMLILALLVIILITIKEQGMFIFDLFNRKPKQIHNQRKTPTRSLVLRPSASTRQYAHSHLSAFKQQPHSNCMSTAFFHTLQNQPSTDNKRTPWLNAKKWWEELYGTIQEHEETAEITPYHNMTKWYNEQICIRTKSALDDRAMQIISQSYHRVINHTNAEILHLEQNIIKRHLCTLHPDKKGTSSAAVLLIEWKGLLTDQARQIEHDNKLPLAALTHLYHNSAKPWIIYELFLQHTFSIQEQLHRDHVQESISHIAEIQDKIIENDENIMRNETVICQLKSDRSAQHIS